MRKALIAVLLLFCCWSPHSPAPLADNSAVVGVWTNKIDSRPTIVLNIEEENGKLIG